MVDLGKAQAKPTKIVPISAFRHAFVYEFASTVHARHFFMRIAAVFLARKNGRGAFRLHAPLILHEGDSHAGDGDDYVPLIRAVLRDGAFLPF